jgi:hypothetical protein
MKKIRQKILRTNSLTREYLNPVTKKRTDIIIYHKFEKISVTTNDLNTLDYLERIHNVLIKINKEYTDGRKKDISYYRVQFCYI